MSAISQTYKGIIIRKNPVEFQISAEVDHEFRLVRMAIDNGWFDDRPSIITAIKIIGTTHITTNHGQHRDQSHLTLAANPGPKKAHLYLLPGSGITATADTSVDELRWD
ncbi:hypothetical protein B0H34DRAFT_802452 [Crassisporium funariophilum]|nr:hypothetical protein B0H34DRAFT_802452 [Crassisporium funariophilum]